MPNHSIHLINLHGPWQLHYGDKVQRVKFPCQLQSTPASQLSRVFHSPTLLDEDQIVALRFEFNILPESISLNDQILAADPKQSIELEITPFLKLTNQVSLKFCPAAECRSITEPVFKVARLEIHQ